MKFIINIALIVSGLVILESCETVVDVDIPIKPPVLVLNGYLNTDSTVSINLTESDFILGEGDFKKISGANIVLKEDGNEVGNFIERSQGIYSSDIKPEKGKLYEVSVSKDGYETVSSSSSIPEETIEISNYSVEKVNRDGFEQYLLKAKFKDPGVKNFYEIGLISYYKPQDPVTGEFLNDSIANFIYLELEGTEFEDSPESFGITVLFNDILFNGEEFELSVLMNYFPSNSSEVEEPPVYITVRNTSEDYYDYVRARRIQDWNDGDPFAEPVFISGNIDNGFGIFAGFNSTFNKIKIEE